MSWSRFLLRAGAVSLVSLALTVARSASAQCIICPDEEPPVVVVSSPSTSYSASTMTYAASVTVEWCDNVSLNQNSWLITHNGVHVSGNFTYESHPTPPCQVAKMSVGTVNLVHGANTVYAEIQDNNGNLGSASVVLTYTQTHRPPFVSLTPHTGEHLSTALCAVHCFDAVYTYTTPAYVSMDAPRAVTLVYRSGQATAMGLVQLDATDSSSTKADKISLRLQSQSGTFVTFTTGTSELYFTANSADAMRLAAQFDAASLATGVHNYTAVVTHYWTGISHSTAVPVKVLVVNEKDSPFGWGWSLAGLQRIHANGDTLLAITEGDGSIAMFRRTTCPSGCNYASPAGDFSTLTSRASVGGDGIKWDRKYPDGTTASFNTTGELLLIKDLYGNQTTYGYTSNRLTTITDPAGKVITLAYGGDNKIETITDPGGRVVTVTIDGSLNVTAIQEPGGGNALQSATYDGSHRLTGYADKRGGAWGIAYDFAGKLAGDTLPTIRADGSDVRPVVGYRSQERTVLVDPASGTGSSSTPARRLKADTITVSVTNPRGYATRMKLHGSGAPSWVRDTLGRESTIARDALWRVTRTTAPSGHVVRFTWHATNRSQLLQHWDSLSATARKVDYEYHATLTGLVTRILGHGLHTWFYYNSTTGHLDSTRSGASNAPLQKFYARSDGRDTLHVDQDAFKTRFLYSSSGFKNTDSVVAEGARRTGYMYDSYGRVASVKNPANATRDVNYDALNRVTSTIIGLDSTLYQYDSLYLKVVRDPLGQRYRFATNALGWVDTLVPPDSSVRIKYRYDRNGNRRFFENRRGQTVETTFDALDRPLFVDAGTHDLTFAYDTTDRWMTVQNSEGRDTVTFDKAGRLIDEITRRGPSSAIRHMVTSIWDDTLGLRKRFEVITTPGSGFLHAVNVTFGSFHQRENFTSTAVGGAGTTFGYNPRRLANSVQLPDGLQILTNWPSTRRPGEITYDNATVSNTVGLKYLHDKMNRVVETRRVSSDTVRSYLYDAWDRLLETTDSTEANPQCAFSWTDGYSCTGPRTYVRHSAYSYDKVGNRNDSSAVINTGNRLRVYGVHSMDYDADGNLTRKYRTADTTVFNQRLYWNELGQLDSVRTTRSGVLTTAHFGYDGFGRRVRKSVGSDTTWFVYDSDNLILELNTAGSVTTHYSYYPGIDRPHAMRRNDSTFYFVADQLGSVVGVVKTNETFAATYRYTPFGVLTDSTPGFVNRLRFAGREYDTESGLYYNRARYYDPQVGRFISEDPIGLEGGINVYSYAGTDPINARDPVGLSPCTERADHIDVSTVSWELNGRRWSSVEHRLHDCTPNSRGPSPGSFRAGAVGGGGGGGGGASEGPTPPSCREVSFPGTHGTIFVRADPATGRLAWTIKMHDPSADDGPWFVRVFVGRRQVDQKKPPKQIYRPHGSVSPVDLKSGATFSILATHLDLMARHYYSVPNACVIP